MVDFDALPRPRTRSTYQKRVENYGRGLLSCGFLWTMADADEVFAAYLRKHHVPDPRGEMKEIRP